MMSKLPFFVLVIVSLPMLYWVFCLLRGQIVDVAGPWFMFWFFCYTGCVWWASASFQHHKNERQDVDD